MAFQSAFVGLVGPTNSGKSTLLNSLIGEKLSIVSPRVQTTYHGVRGILNGATYQLVFTDTPGLQKHSDSVAQLLNKVSDRNAKDCDLVVWVWDPTNPRMLAQFQKLRSKIEASKTPRERIAVINKIDRMPKPHLLPLLQALAETQLFSEILPISARTGDGLGRLVKLLLDRAPEGAALFPEDTITDRSEQFLISELIREKIYRETKQEIPYSAWVEIEEWDKEGRVPVIRAVIHADASSRKAILIGKGGLMLKEIGMEARKDVERLLGYQICLKLHVDVQGDWKKDSRHLHRYLELG